ncbi:hypothetical protein ACTA71_005332 [Dictyostelium dimigraforme]
MALQQSPQGLHHLHHHNQQWIILSTTDKSLSSSNEDVACAALVTFLGISLRDELCEIIIDLAKKFKKGKVSTIYFSATRPRVNTELDCQENGMPQLILRVNRLSRTPLVTLTLEPTLTSSETLKPNVQC